MLLTPSCPGVSRASTFFRCCHSRAMRSIEPGNDGAGGKTWMAGTFGSKTRFELQPGHDASCNNHRPINTSTWIEVSTLLPGSCQLDRIGELAHGRFQPRLAPAGKGS